VVLQNKPKNQPTTMIENTTDNSLRESLISSSDKDAARLLNETLRGCVRAAFFDAMREEVDALCGPKYKPVENPYHRAGSEVGRAYLGGEKEAVIRPRVRHEEDGEIGLEVYKAASQASLFDEVTALLGQGISQRGLARAKSGSLSKSAAGRMWEAKSREQLAHLRGRDLSNHDLVAMMIDGVRLANELWVIVALGITMEGKKVVLDFQEGSSESKASVSELIQRLRNRGIDEPEARKLLVLRDGSTSIKSAVSEYWPAAVQQECLVHMHRHTRDKLAKRDRADFDRHCKTLRQAQGKEAGEEAFTDLIEFLAERNAAAGLALESRRDDLLAFHRLDVKSTLNVTFLNTNCIENSLRNWREATGNVKRWRENSEMVSRWVSSGMLWAEAGFRKIRHASDLGELAAALASGAVSSSLRSKATAPAARAAAPKRAKTKSRRAKKPVAK